MQRLGLSRLERERAVAGALMKAMQGGPPAQAYMVLHVIFGAALLAALVVYLFSTEQLAEKIPPIAV